MKKRVPFIISAFILAFFQPVCALNSQSSENFIENCKVYCTATIEDNFSDDSIIVVINKEYSEKNIDFSLVQFKQIQANSISKLTQEIDSVADTQNTEKTISPNECIEGLTDADNFRQIIKIKLQNPGKENVLQAIKELENLEFVESAEPDYYFYQENINSDFIQDDALSSDDIEPEAITPNDPRYSNQYALTKLEASAAWSISTGSSSVRVGIIDSGISNHSDLAGNLVGGWDFVNDNNITTDDPSGHGTHVAGIIGARGNNSTGISGVNWNVSLVPLQVYSHTDSNGNVLFSGSAIIDAIDYARTNSIPIINCSFGSLRSSYAYETQMRNYSGLIVCSAGNGKDHDNDPDTPNIPVNTDVEPHDPSSCPLDNIISVASTNSSDTLASTSNYGTTSVDLAAPGVGILSTIPGNTYGNMSGTSMAAPHVTGVAALVKSYCPNLNASQIKHIILSSVDRPSALNGKVLTRGRLNAQRAMEYARDYGEWMTDQMVSGDFNGDGKDDIAAFIDMNNGATQIYMWPSTGGSFSGVKSPAVWFNANWPEYTASKVTGRVVSGDFNGDGKDDIAAFYDYGNNETRTHVWLSTGSTFTYQGNRGWWLSSTYNPNMITGRVVSGDFNGDGRDDIAVFCDYGNAVTKTHVLLSTGSAFTFQANNGWWSSSTYNPNMITGRVVSGDFNGDGKDDIAAFYNYGSNTTKAHMWRSTGSAFTLQGNNGWWASSEYNADRITGRVVSGDFNDDGKDDIAAFYSYGKGNAKIHTFKSSGSAFPSCTTWYQTNPN